MLRRINPLRIVRNALVALLGAAALACAGLCIAQALSPPRPAGRPYSSLDRQVVTFKTPRHALSVELYVAQLEFVCQSRVCWRCHRIEPEHEANCMYRPSADGRWQPSKPPLRDHRFAVPGCVYYDFWWGAPGLTSAHLEVSLWLLIALFAPYPLYVLVSGPLRRRLRHHRGACVACGYDLTGNVSGTCPECGRPAVAAT